MVKWNWKSLWYKSFVVWPLLTICFCSQSFQCLLFHYCLIGKQMYFNYSIHQTLVFMYMYVIYRPWQPNMQLSLCETVKTGKFWKLFYHSEFMGNWFRDFESVKSTALTHLKALDFDFLNFCTFWRQKLTKITKFRAPKIAKICIFETFTFSKLISRKIWITEKSWIFHTLQKIL